MTAQIDEGVSFYLQNNPFPAKGDTASQAILPLSTVPPTTATHYNFDTNRDAPQAFSLLEAAAVTPKRIRQKSNVGSYPQQMAIYN